MKKAILFLGVMFLTIHVNAQILTLEHTYDSAACFYLPSIFQQLYVVKLEVDGEKYLFVDRKDKQLRFYNLDHTSWKTISFAAATDLNPSADAQSIMYISQHLFDNDDEIEFLYSDQSGASFLTQIVNEDGSILFTANHQAPFAYGNAPQVEVPIYNTVAGAKLILSGLDGKAYVYSLIGTLAGIATNSNGEGNLSTSFAYPNPSASSTRIDYTLPDGVNSGQIIFYDQQGQEVKRFHVDRGFDSLTISTEDLRSGIYYYNLQTLEGLSGMKKLVTIK